MSIAKKEPRKSRKQPALTNSFDLETPWPENLDGFVVPQKQIERFIGNQKLIRAQITAKRFMVVADAGRAIAKRKNISMNRKLIRYIVGLDMSREYQAIMKAMIAAINKGGQGIMAAYRTTRYIVEYGFEYTTCCNREKLYHDKLRRVMKSL